MTIARLRADAHACFAAAVAAVEPAAAAGRALARDGETSLLQDAGTVVARHRGPVCVVGAGKAAPGMARAAAAILGPSITSGLVHAGITYDLAAAMAVCRELRYTGLYSIKAIGQPGNPLDNTQKILDGVLASM